jgi:hypothetical protein
VRTARCDGRDQTFAAAPEVTACVFCGRDALIDLAPAARVRGACPS